MDDLLDIIEFSVEFFEEHLEDEEFSESVDYRESKVKVSKLGDESKIEIIFKDQDLEFVFEELNELDSELIFEELSRDFEE